MENYTIYDEIGRGTQSFVYKARRKGSIEYVAVKSTAKARMDKILNEVQILHKLDSRFVLKFYNWYESTNHIWLIFEYCIGGDLLNLITQDRQLPEPAVQAFGWELVAGLRYLHANNILYCDLKPANVLIDECGTLKLADFGVARRIPTKESMLTKQLAPGSPNYMAPELFQPPAVYSFASDFWALGCVLYELCTGRQPFTHTNFPELARIIQTEPLQIPTEECTLSPSLIDLLHKLLEKDAYRRITWDELVVHPFWTGCAPMDDVTMPPQEVFDASRPPESHELVAESLSISLFEPPLKHFAPPYDSHGAAAAPADPPSSPTTESASDDSGGSTELSEDNDDGSEDHNQHDDERMGHGDYMDEQQDVGQLQKGSRPMTAPTAGDKTSAAGSQVHPQHERPIPKTAPSREKAHHATKSTSSPQQQQRRPSSTSASITLKKPSRLLFTAADSAIKPIAFCNDMENVTTPQVNPELLDFESMSAHTLLACTSEELEDHLKGIYVALKAVDASTSEKANVLAHLLRLCLESKLANVIVNSSLLTLLIKMLHHKGGAELWPRIALLLGVLFRFATFHASTSPEQMQSLVTSLQQMIQNSPTAAAAKSTKTSNSTSNSAYHGKRNAMACLGELLFYRATQQTTDSIAMTAGMDCLLEALDDHDIVTKHYAARTVTNILAHASDDPTTLRALVTEQVIASLLRSLDFSSSSHDPQCVVLKTTITQAIAQVVRHTRFPAAAAGTWSTAQVKTALLVLLSKPATLSSLWQGVASGHEAPDLAVASFNVLSTYLEMSSGTTTPTADRKRDKQLQQAASAHDAMIMKHKAMLLDKIVAMSVLETLVEVRGQSALATTTAIATQASTHGFHSPQAHDNEETRSFAGRRYTDDEKKALPSLLRAKAILFVHFGIHRSNKFAKKCIHGGIIDKLEHSLAPFHSTLRGKQQPVSPPSGSFSMGSTGAAAGGPPSLQHLPAFDQYLVQCGLNLVRLCIRTALKMSADCISSSNRMIDYGDDDDQDGQDQDLRCRVAVEPFQLLEQLVKNPTCRTQLCLYFVANEGKAFTFFIRLMSKLLTSFASERLPSMGIHTTVGAVIARMLRRLFHGSGAADAAVLVASEAQEIFEHLLPAIVVQLQQANNNLEAHHHHHQRESEENEEEEEEEEDDHSVNCIQLVYLVMLHLEYDFSEADFERRDIFTTDHLLPCFAALFASPSASPSRRHQNENVWRFAVELLHGLVVREPSLLLDAITAQRLVGPIVALLSAPKQNDYHSLPSSATALVKIIVEKSKKANVMRSLYTYGIASHVSDALAYLVASKRLSAATVDLLEVLYLLLYTRCEELRKPPTSSSSEPSEPSNFKRLVECGPLVLSLVVQVNGKKPDDEEPQYESSSTSAKTKTKTKTKAAAEPSDNSNHASTALQYEILEVASRCLVYLSQIFGAHLNDVLFGKTQDSDEISRAIVGCLHASHQHDAVQLRVLVTIKNCLRCDKKSGTPATKKWLQNDKLAISQITRIANDPKEGANQTKEQIGKAATEILLFF